MRFYRPFRGTAQSALTTCVLLACPTAAHSEPVGLFVFAPANLAFGDLKQASSITQVLPGFSPIASPRPWWPLLALPGEGGYPAPPAPPGRLLGASQAALGASLVRWRSIPDGRRWTVTPCPRLPIVQDQPNLWRSELALPQSPGASFVFIDAFSAPWKGSSARPDEGGLS